MSHKQIAFWVCACSVLCSAAFLASCDQRSTDLDILSFETLLKPVKEATAVEYSIDLGLRPKSAREGISWMAQVSDEEVPREILVNTMRSLQRFEQVPAASQEPYWLDGITAKVFEPSGAELMIQLAGIDMSGHPRCVRVSRFLDGKQLLKREVYLRESTDVTAVPMVDFLVNSTTAIEWTVN